MAKQRKWRRHTIEFKRQVVERMKTCGNIEALARELDLERKLLYSWKYNLRGGRNRGMPIWGKPQKNAKRINCGKRSSV